MKRFTSRCYVYAADSLEICTILIMKFCGYTKNNESMKIQVFMLMMHFVNFCACYFMRILIRTVLLNLICVHTWPYKWLISKNVAILISCLCLGNDNY